MTKQKLSDAARRAGRTFAQAAVGVIVAQTAWPQSGVGWRAVGAAVIAAGGAAVWRAFLDPPEPQTGGWLRPPERQPNIQVHVAGTDPAKVADEVAKAVRRHPAAGRTVDTGALTRHPVTAEPPPPPDPGKPSS